MSNAGAALGYLTRCTVVNQVQRQAGRLRKPQYAIAILVAIAYFALVFMMPGSNAPSPGPAGVPHLKFALAVAGLLIYLAGAWLLREGTELAFSNAEILFFFPAPLTHRQLLVYRVLRSQFVILLNAALWTMISHRYVAGAPAIVRFGAVWGLLTLLSMHRMVVALLRVRPRTPLRQGFLWIGQTAAVAALVALIASVIAVMRDIAPLGRHAIFAAIPALLDHGPASVPLRLVAPLAMPLRSDAAPPLAASFAILFGVVAVHLLAILQLNVPFEEEVSVASARRAAILNRIRGARSGQFTVRAHARSRFAPPLAEQGSAIIALTWKNTIALLRSSAGRSFAISLGLLLVMTRVITTNDGATSWIAYAGLAVFALLFGPRMLRNDLRHDLPKLADLRTYPLRGREIVIGELMSPALILSLIGMMLGAIALFSVPGLMLPPDGESIAAAIVVVFGGAIAIIAINTMNIAVQNGVALLFPAWVRVGLSTGGIEAFGQMVIAAFGTVLALLLSLLAPMALFAGIVTLVRATGAATALQGFAIAAIPATTLLAIEVIALVDFLGRLFDRIEPVDVN